uniref:Ig-like domain-containing protein n=1 Tax=Callorhinchus milii TaxID=7868 RepID=A0A4W3IY43_CALMI
DPRSYFSMSQSSVTVAEGGQVTLDSIYHTSLSVYCLYWYRHLSVAQPEYILQRCTNTSEHKENFAKSRFSDELQTSRKSRKLTISQLELSDAAVYYCVFSPTGMGTSHSLVQKLSWICEVALRRAVCFQEIRNDGPNGLLLFCYNPRSCGSLFPVKYK